MPDDRDSNLPLVVGAVVAVVLHAAVLPLVLVGFTPPTGHALVRTAELDQPLPTSRELRLGQDDSPVSSVAWIAHDDYQKLIAPKAQTEQPALQQMVDPTPQAPMILDATPPAPQSREQPNPSRAEQTEVDTQDLQTQIQTLAERQPAAPSLREVLVNAPSDDAGELAAGELAQTPTEGSSTVDHPQATPSSQAQPSQAAAQASGLSRPTSAARSESESSATQIDPLSVDLRQGAVTTGEGLTLTPVHPRISPVTRASTLPRRNPVVTLTFDPDGVVRNVVFLKPTGSAQWDAPIEASLYKWRASGEKLKDMTSPFEVEVTILFYQRESGE